jgi:hypothetical protein
MDPETLVGLALGINVTVVRKGGGVLYGQWSVGFTHMKQRGTLIWVPRNQLQ